MIEGAKLRHQIVLTTQILPVPLSWHPPPSSSVNLEEAALLPKRTRTFSAGATERPPQICCSSCKVGFGYPKDTNTEPRGSWPPDTALDGVWCGNGFTCWLEYLPRRVACGLDRVAFVASTICVMDSPKSRSHHRLLPGYAGSIQGHRPTRPFPCSITGESGTGKELIACAISRSRSRFRCLSHSTTCPSLVVDDNATTETSWRWCRCACGGCFALF